MAAARNTLFVLAIALAACEGGAGLVPAGAEDAGETPATPDTSDSAAIADAEAAPAPDATPAEPDASVEDAAAGDPDAAPLPSACPTPALMSGDHEFTIEHGGRTRRYDLHVPPSYDATRATPLVLYFHPLLTNKSYLQLVGTKDKADAENFLAAYPDGVRNSWNAGTCCGPANGVGIGAEEIDDVGFVRAMIAAIEQVACVDPDRVYAAGFSNGGFLSERLACEAADVIAAIAAVSSSNTIAPSACAPSRPIPVFAINGTNDNLVPYDGGGEVIGVTSGPFRSVAAVFSEWAARNGCTGAPTSLPPNGDAACETYSTCNAAVEVTQCTVTGGGHCWYGEPFCALGRNSDDILATDETWAFLSRFSLPHAP